MMNYFVYIIFAVVIIIFAIILWYEKKRKEELKKSARRIGFSFSPKKDANLLSTLVSMKLFILGHSHKADNIMKGELNRIEWTVFDYKYTIGYGKHRSTHIQTVAFAQPHDMDLPKFSLGPESFFHKIGDILGYKDIDFDTNLMFSKKYLLKGLDETEIRKLFSSEILNYFEKKNGPINVEADRNKIIIYISGKRAKPQNLRSFILSASEIVNLFRYQ